MHDYYTYDTFACVGVCIEFYGKLDYITYIDIMQ
jgi:hypothetical protein